MLLVRSPFAQDVVTVEPGDDLQAAVDRVAAGGELRLGAGQYRIAEPTRITTPGITLKALPPASARLVASNDFSGGPLVHVSVPNVTISGITFDGQFIRNVRGVRGVRNKDNPEDGAIGLVVENCELTRLTRHAVDIDGHRSIVRGTRIHKILWNEHGERRDAHGVVTTFAKGLRIENVDISQCSGDAFQAERGSWDDLRITDSHLWDSPLEEDMAGFSKGTYVSENAIDTKHRYSDRGHIAIVNCRIHGFRSKLINNTSALNLKENVDAVIDSCDVYNSQIGFRLRGRGKGMSMFPLLMNCVVRNNGIAFRLENKLRKFRMFHCTMFQNRSALAWGPSRKTWSRSYYDWDPSQWSNVNNLWIGVRKLPEIASSSRLGAVNNVRLTREAVADDLSPRHGGSAVETPPVVESWYEPTGRVLKDKAGRKRKKPSTVGAYEAVN